MAVKDFIVQAPGGQYSNPYSMAAHLINTAYN
jgi:hypothetical protein